MNDAVRALISKMINCVPYELEYNDSIPMQDYLKAFEVKFSETGTDLVEHLITYIKIIHQVLNKEIVVLVGLKEYLNESELSYLYERYLYDKIRLIIIEHYFSGTHCSEKTL